MIHNGELVRTGNCPEFVSELFSRKSQA